MPLERIDSEIVREERGFSFSMRVAGSQQTIRIFISDDALEGDTADLDEDSLRAQLLADRAALEAVASEKFCRGRVTADRIVAITLTDIVNFTE
jgi:hypothetical protein